MPSIADGIEEPVPGLLSGGPNPGRQDGCKYAFTEPETASLMMIAAMHLTKLRLTGMLHLYMQSTQ